MGYLADKLRSRRKLFALTVLVGEIPCYLSGFARNYYELLFLGSLTGIGLAGAESVGRAIMADLYLGRRVVGATHSSSLVCVLE